MNVPSDLLPTPAARMHPGMWLIPVLYLVFITAEFATMTELALRLTAQGSSAMQVGLLATSMWVGVLLSSSLAHRTVGLIHRASIMLLACAAAGFGVGSMWLHSQYILWLIAAFALGLSGGVAWVVAEAWFAEAAPTEQRGLYVGIFESSVGAGLMLGPLMVPLGHWLEVSVAWISGGLMLSALLICLALRCTPALSAPVEHKAEQVMPSPWIQAAPLAAIALLGGLMESGIASLLPSISMRVGFSLEAAALLGTVIGAGSALLQPPAGQLSDRFGTRRIMMAAWLFVLATNMAMFAWADQHTWVLWLTGFSLGGVGGAIYTLIVVELGHRFSGSTLVASMGMLITSYSIGTAIGPTSGGWLFDQVGLAGLALVLAALSALGYAFTHTWLSPSPAATRPPTAPPQKCPAS